MTDVGASVSVVVTNYNHAPFLRGAVQSVLVQTRTPDEVIVIDDCSTDESPKVLASLPRDVTVVRNERNLGVVRSRNKGLASAHSKYVVFLDADDELLPWCLQTMLRMKRLSFDRRLAVMYSPARQLNGSRRGYMHSRGHDRKELAIANYIPNTALLLRCAALEAGGYADEMADLGYEDWDLWLRLVERGWKCRLIARPLFLYRSIAGSRNSIPSVNAGASRSAIEARHPWIIGATRQQTLVARARRGGVMVRQKVWRQLDGRSWLRP